VSKAFGSTRACDDVSLEVEAGEFLTLLGDSGCGKTTLLRIVAGFATPDSGTVRVSGRDMTSLPPAKRGMGFVFQSYALFPTKTVAENIGFALKVRGTPRAARRARVEELAEIVEIGPLLDRFPHELSGGQQQRVALARALAPSPPILLLDEPLSALDARIRARLRLELKSLVRRLGLTAIYVTHDQEEALALSDRIAVMRGGRILQVDTPHAVYHRPASAFVAGFIGVTNVVEAVVDAGALRVDGIKWPLPLGLSGRPDGAVRLAWRPESIALNLIEAPGKDALVGRVRGATFLGGVDRTEVEIGDRVILVDRASTDHPLPIGALVAVAPDPDRAILLSEAQA
jgi:ABC-type Fe3+/spermidine/putrescine transport system ATPase subunit